MNFSLARCGTKAQSLTNKEGTQVFLFQRYLLSEVVSWGNHAFNLLSHSSTDLRRACQSPGLFWTLRFTTKIPAEGTYPGRKLERLESFNPIPEKTGLVPVHQIQNDVMTCFSFFFFFWSRNPVPKPNHIPYSPAYLLGHKPVYKVKSFLGISGHQEDGKPWLPTLKTEHRYLVISIGPPW